MVVFKFIVFSGLRNKFSILSEILFLLNGLPNDRSRLPESNISYFLSTSSQRYFYYHEKNWGLFFPENLTQTVIRWTKICWSVQRFCYEGYTQVLYCVRQNENTSRNRKVTSLSKLTSTSTSVQSAVWSLDDIDYNYIMKIEDLNGDSVLTYFYFLMPETFH